VSELTFALPDELVQAIAESAAEIILSRLGDLETNGHSPWLSLKDAADDLGVSERTLQRMLARGKLRSRTIGRRRASA